MRFLVYFNLDRENVTGIGLQDVNHIRPKLWIKRVANAGARMIITRVSFETIFDSKQPKLEPKLVLALSETKHLFRLFRIYTETESFDVTIEPKQTEDQLKQFDREHILVFFSAN